MILAENNKPSFAEFEMLMKRTDLLLNTEALDRQQYYANRNGRLLEEDVYEALCKCAKSTPFEDSIALVSGAAFPDIVANKYYGVEVKSTNKNHWKSIGSSILESTRITDVERIFLTFGKLGNPVRFKSKPYEMCLSGISVTHYPRYQIDMNLSAGETIFDKIGISYEELRKMENPVSPVSKYYKSLLKPGESLWWAPDDSSEEDSSPPILRLWTSLNSNEKEFYKLQGYAFFPEIFSSSTTKYQNFALWLTKSCSIVNTNIRDMFTAGGKVDLYTEHNRYPKMPRIFKKIQTEHDSIENLILDKSDDFLKKQWNVSTLTSNKIALWCRIVSKYAETEIYSKDYIYNMLLDIMHIAVPKSLLY